MVPMRVLPICIINWALGAAAFKNTCPHTASSPLEHPFSPVSTTFFDFQPKDEHDNPYDLSQHAGQVVLIFNTASECGYTPQLQGLQTLYQDITTTHRPQNFTLLALPCNQFGAQEPGSNSAIQSFCKSNYGTTFPILGKTDVLGVDAEPVVQWMVANDPTRQGPIRWNFEKFLIGRDGGVKGRWGSWTTPEEIQGEVERELVKGS